MEITCDEELMKMKMSYADAVVRKPAGSESSAEGNYTPSLRRTELAGF